MRFSLSKYIQQLDNVFVIFNKTPMNKLTVKKFKNIFFLLQLLQLFLETISSLGRVKYIINNEQMYMQCCSSKFVEFLCIHFF